MARVFLGVQAALFISYGLYCLLIPGSLAGAAGVAANSTTGTIELQAMYGGLQTAVGIMCLVGLLRRQLEAGAMYALLFVFAGLALVRASLALLHGDFSSYTLYASLYESFCLLFLAWYARQRRLFQGLQPR